MMEINNKTASLPAMIGGRFGKGMLEGRLKRSRPLRGDLDLENRRAAGGVRLSGPGCVVVGVCRSPPARQASHVFESGPNAGMPSSKPL